LEFPKCLIGVWAEHAVVATGIKAELIEAALEFGDIVTNHEMSGDVMHDAVTKLPARFFEPAVCVPTDDSVDGESAFLLESTYRPIDVVVECVSAAREEPDVHESVANLGNGRADVTAAQVHYR
jgi:hypothetical protein